jgi:hypothetical protein
MSWPRRAYLMPDSADGFEKNLPAKRLFCPEFSKRELL